MEELLEKLNETIPGADAEFKIKVKGDNCKTSGEGNFAGMLLGLSTLANTIREQMEKEEIEREAIEFLLENSLKIDMEEIYE